MSHVTKIVLIVVMLRARNKSRKTKYGFMQDNGTGNSHLHTENFGRKSKGEARGCVVMLYILSQSF